MITCIASDLDGTIVRDDNTITPFTKDVLTTVMKQGVRFLPCTGRCYQDFRSAFPDDLQIPAILLNGALFVDYKGNEILSQPIENVFIKQMEQQLWEAQLPCMYYTRYAIYGSGDLLGMDNCMLAYYSKDLQIEYFIAPIQKVGGIHEIHDPVLKMESMSTDLKRIEQQRHSLSYLNGLQVSSSLPYNIEITARGVNKASMLLKALDHYHIAESELIYFGDSNNDLEVFQRFPHTIAPDNACEEIKRLAGEICGSCEEDGVAHYIKEKYHR